MTTRSGPLFVPKPVSLNVPVGVRVGRSYVRIVSPPSNRFVRTLDKRHGIPRKQDNPYG